MEQRTTEMEVRVIARNLDENADRLEGVIVLALRDGHLLQAYSALDPEDRRALLDAARASA